MMTLKLVRGRKLAPVNPKDFHKRLAALLFEWFTGQTRHKKS
jgi:hypothetical protein